MGRLVSAAESLWQEAVRGLAARGLVLAPARGEGGVFLQRQGADAPMLWNVVRPVEPLKGLFFPARESVTGEESLERSVVIGAKACDLAALPVLDGAFRDGPFPDPRYVARREKAVIVAVDCPEILPSCFCVLVGGNPWPESGFDLCLSPDPSGTGGRMLIEVGSAKGEGLLEETGLRCEPVSDADREARTRARDALRARADEAVRPHRAARSYEEIVRAHLDDGAWEEVAAPCVECGACSYICPTCHCYILNDLSDAAAFRKVRKWDSCLYTGYARVAGGANPRERRAERLQNRFACKFHYLKENFGVLGCTGCGRCIDACQGGVDPRDVVAVLDGRAAVRGASANDGR